MDEIADQWHGKRARLTQIATGSFGTFASVPVRNTSAHAANPDFPSRWDHRSGNWW
jgi:hypothetical protein